MRKYSIISGLLAAGLAVTPATAETLNADVWSDNWFAFYLGEMKIAEDSVPITTERSFNSESFSFEAKKPYVLNFIVKDFKENDTGLEYIGSRRQQMGDGGFIAQFKDQSGELIAVTDSSWRCLVVHNAPVDKTCEKERDPQEGVGKCASVITPEPDGWKSVSFDDSSWPSASAYSEDQVRPKDGYDRVKWDSNAELIWGPDLETNNTLLCRKVVD